MMDNQLPLRDIHLPDGVAWWPPAPGWWLSLVLLLLMSGLLYLLYKRLRQPLLNKSAREELAALTDRYRQHGDKQLLLQDLSSLLRRIGISYLGREQVAGITGDRWYQQLNQLGARQDFSASQIALLSEAAYQSSPELSEQDIDALVRQTRRWLSGLPRRRMADV